MIRTENGMEWNGKNNQSKNINNSFLLPAFGLSYTLSNFRDQFFFTNYTDENFLLAQNNIQELGYTHLFENKTKATFSYIGLHGGPDEWSNPY